MSRPEVLFPLFAELTALGYLDPMSVDAEASDLTEFD